MKDKTPIELVIEAMLATKPEREKWDIDRYKQWKADVEQLAAAFGDDEILKVLE